MATSLLLVDTKAMKVLAADLKVVSVEAEKAFYVGLAAAGEIVAEKARRNADSFPRKESSTRRISESVMVRARGVSVRIQAGGNDAPEAAPLEHHGIPGKFRHPVFGNRAVWVDQTAHPFLTPAGVESEVPVLEAISAACDVAYASMGM